MVKRRQIDPSLLVVACFSRHAEALDWAQGRLQAAYGAIDRVSPDLSFHHTDYYTASMGRGLRKRLIVFEQLQTAQVLASVKNFTIGLEAEAARSGRYAEERPLNLDPGLLQLGKFLLATTKDQAHRIYLQDGIYAEVTLRFEDKKFECWPWTYADYREPALCEFLNEAREALFQRVLRLRADVVSKSDSLPSDLRGERS
jgi:Domain of unknown function (DUF4416)